MYDNVQPNNIKQQYEAYKSDNGVDQAKSDAIANELGKIDAKDGKCESIAKGFIQVNNANKGVLEKIYLLDSSVRDAIYKKNPVGNIGEKCNSLLHFVNGCSKLNRRAYRFSASVENNFIKMVRQHTATYGSMVFQMIPSLSNIAIVLLGA